jgi:hypothetical protein
VAAEQVAGGLSGPRSRRVGGSARMEDLAGRDVDGGRILGCETEDESAGLDRGWWSPWSSAGLCPVSRDAATVPGDEGVGGDDPAGSAGIRPSVSALSNGAIWEHGVVCEGSETEFRSSKPALR